MSGRVDTGLEVLEELKALFSEEAPCEGEGHGRQDWHPYEEEPGEWYTFLHCPGCGFDRVSLLCNTGKEFAMWEYISCRSCSDAFPSRDIIQKFVRKGETQ